MNMTLNATDPDTAARIQNMLKTTAPAVERVPIADEPLEVLRAGIEALCRRVAQDMVEAEAAVSGPAKDPSKMAVTTMVTVIEAVALETLKLQRRLWDEAARRGVTQSDVARARGVRQQTQQRIARRAQGQQP